MDITFASLALGWNTAQTPPRYHLMYPLTLFDILRARDFVLLALFLVACGAFTLYWAVRALH